MLRDDWLKKPPAPAKTRAGGWEGVGVLVEYVKWGGFEGLDGDGVLEKGSKGGRGEGRREG